MGVFVQPPHTEVNEFDILCVKRDTNPISAHTYFGNLLTKPKDKLLALIEPPNSIGEWVQRKVCRHSRLTKIQVLSAIQSIKVYGRMAMRCST